MNSNQTQRRSFFKKLTTGVALLSTPSIIKASLQEEPQIQPFNVLLSDCVSRSKQEIYRDRPSVLDYDGVYDSLSLDSYSGLQRAFDSERELVMPRNFRCLVSAPLIIKQRGFHLYGGSKVATQIHANHNGNVIEVGETASATGYAPRCILENFSIYGNGKQTGGIVLWDKKSFEWADASKGCRLSDLIINDIGAGPMLRIRSWANLIEHVETTQGCLQGIAVEQQALTNTFIHPYITGCAKEGIIVGDIPERVETCNSVFIGAIVQQCGGETSNGAIVINGAASTAFYDLYLERNGEKGAYYDINVSELAVATEIRNVTSRGTIKSALIRDAGQNTIVKNVWRYGNADSIIRRVGTDVSGDYGGFYQANGTLANGYVRDLATGSAKGRYSFFDKGVQSGNSVVRRKALTSAYTIPYDGQESGCVYHTESSSSTVVTLPKNAIEGLCFDIVTTGTGTLSLSAESGASINGTDIKNLLPNQLYKVVCIKNTGGTSAQWSTNA